MEHKGRPPSAFKSLLMGQMAAGRKPLPEPALGGAPGPQQLGEAQEIERQELFSLALESTDGCARAEAMRLLVERYPDGATLTFAGAHCPDLEVSLKAVEKLIAFGSLEGLAIVRAETCHPEVVERVNEFLIRGK
ncbi:MAG TPA: hypothetical protein VLD37_01440 [Candidatus Bilamarchaeum sp.]|nr:hypothetical protein [Candidatus Bilamarchaeum sp.]